MTSESLPSYLIDAMRQTRQREMHLSTVHHPGPVKPGSQGLTRHDSARFVSLQVQLRRVPSGRSVHALNGVTPTDAYWDANTSRRGATRIGAYYNVFSSWQYY